MKQQIITIAAITLFAISITNAQSTVPAENTKIHRITKNLVTALRSGNAGAVESALRMTALTRLRYPAADMSELTEAVEEIREKNSSGTTRYKAYITLSFFENPSWYADVHEVVHADEVSFFPAASQRMQHELLSMNN
jgi:hypothetical protein